MKVYLDCTKCNEELDLISNGDFVRFYFFKYNIDEETVKIEKITKVDKMEEKES